jgi:hypothetical protein
MHSNQITKDMKEWATVIAVIWWLAVLALMPIMMSGCAVVAGAAAGAGAGYLAGHEAGEEEAEEEIAEHEREQR